MKIKNTRNQFYVDLVHSSPYLYTVQKLVVGLVELLRVMKGHKISCCALIGFALPKLGVKRCIVKIEVSYYHELRKFFSSHLMIKNVADFENELHSALDSNKMTLQKCQDYHFKDEAYQHVVMCSPEELAEYGNNATQLKCNYGILVEANVDGKTYCVKKPSYRDSYWHINLVKDDIKGVIKYKEFTSLDLVCYTKVKYDPLTEKELAQCMYYFIPAVFKVIKSIKDKQVLHRDVRVPNICFDEDCSPVVIDFDFADRLSIEQRFVDFQTFIEDVINHLCRVEYIDQTRLKEDVFLKKIKEEGILDEKLLKKSYITVFDQPISSVIHSHFFD
ncbi:uncharacterized protein [Dysidea avara]|uniref:uncharacterized protein n=1 Tax=Dysidea avara TaxID=196820 RepID=UPI0033196A0A